MAKRGVPQCEFCGNVLPQDFQKNIIYTCSSCGCGYKLVDEKGLREAVIKAASGGNEVSFLEVGSGYLVFSKKAR